MKYNRQWTEELQNILAHLRCVEGLDASEIAAIMNRTPTAIIQQIRVLGLCFTPQAILIRKSRGIRRGPRPKTASHQTLTGA